MNHSELTLQEQIILWKQEVALLQERYQDRRGKMLPIPSDLIRAVEQLRQLEQQERLEQHEKDIKANRP